MSRKWQPEDDAFLSDAYGRDLPDAWSAHFLKRSSRSVAIRRCHLGLVVQNLKRASIRDYDDVTLVRELRRRGFDISMSGAVSAAEARVFAHSTLSGNGHLL